MKDIIEALDELHRAGKMYGLTIWPVKGGYQVNLAVSAPNSFRVRRADTPSEGLRMVLDMDYVDKFDAAPPAASEPLPEVIEGYDKPAPAAEPDASVFD